jgi:enoyl-CoA hydratase/carnithine racemase
MSELSIERPDDHVEVWTLRGAARRNSLTRVLVSALVDELVERLPPSGTRVVVLTGEGESFCSGADLKERAGMSIEDVHRFLGNLAILMDGIEQSNAVFIAALNGSAFGGGTELALACDLRLAASEAELALTEVSWGILPGAGGTQRLPRLVGLGLAKELILTGRRVSSGEARSIGLLNDVVPREQLLTRAVDLAGRIARNAPIAVAGAKRALNAALDLPLAEGLVFERRQYETTIGTKDRLEGLAAFREKRPPNYRGE